MKKILEKLVKRKNAETAMADPQIIAIDFDGTCVTENYPGVGRDLPGAVQTLHALNDSGHRLILWTCREGKELEAAINWFKEREIPLFGINETPSEADFRKEGGRKVYADLYIDDRVPGGFPGWSVIHKQFFGCALKKW